MDRARGLQVAVNGRLVIPEAELHERFSRSSGPGGQGVNTTDSRVELTFDVERSRVLPDRLRVRMLHRLRGRLVDGRITVVASQHRTQLANRKAARERLARLLHDATTAPPPKRRATRRTRASQERRLRAKKARAEVKRGRAHRTPD
ncbi:MAG: aminoacyl-tRNA hydrolase [Intrasporangium sp.]|uniref:alternative ribosome rescue aminoacyl-tRNA hydrolase ArfB n=1 Tax=Intrasporangium sp. TaxID=1925024 RepID=UPI00264A04A8|nr:alternative ribosome rescue aminoacyl-tRNA hydrolase ArfB [Intrasporangium sp.]MDN5795529.1 aminoacyl-tRNA hydrolase [Intrasporangium sp.]